MTMSLKREEFELGPTGSHGECHVKMKAEVRVMHRQANEHPNLPANHGSQETSMRESPSQPQKESPELGDSSFVILSHLVYDRPKYLILWFSLNSSLLLSSSAFKPFHFMLLSALMQCLACNKNWSTHPEWILLS